ncbi:MAG: hypothetical protein QOE92_1458 [Chloroflexota bacterium]|jgi:flavin reductase (DIM6/NTAB) family NADH-FMN oxidoreductase RutF|nr:hypothetical protein [Chloroflexota bacterium]
MDEATFRNALGYFATGVSVVTMSDPGGEVGGFTANSFTSVSLDPPLVLVCVDKAISSHPTMEAAPGFVVNILSDQQEELARRFATPDIDKLAGIATSDGPFGAPRIDGCLAYVVARSHSRHDGGDHTIFVGEVTDTEVGEGMPLLFYRGMYGLPGTVRAG